MIKQESPQIGGRHVRGAQLRSDLVPFEINFRCQGVNEALELRFQKLSTLSKQGDG